MVMGRQTDPHGDLMVTWTDLPRSPGHVFYDRLQQVLVEAGFDGFVEATCKPYYSEGMGTKSIRRGGTSACIWWDQLTYASGNGPVCAGHRHRHHNRPRHRSFAAKTPP